jgi:hypothetical protein
VISFHGYIDDEINVYEGWLNGIANKTMYSHGPINVVNRFSNAGVKFNGYINCEGKHPVKDLIFYSKNPQDVESRYNNLINTFNYITLTSSDPLFAIKMKELKYEMEQTMDIIDISTSFFMNNTSPSNSTYYIEPKIKNVNGHYNFKSSCESSPFEVNASKSEIVDNIKIFPSPANLDWIEIDILDWEQYKKGYLYNIEGQLIKEINLESDRNIIDISDINNGIYIFKFEKNKLPIFRKIVIQK